MNKKNNASKVILAILLFVFILLPEKIILAEENLSKSNQTTEIIEQYLKESEKTTALNLCNHLLTRQFNALITGNDVETRDIFYESDNTILYNQFLRWRIKQSQVMHTSWSSYDYNLLNVDYVKDAENILIHGSFNLKYTYTNGLEGRQDNINFDARVKSVDNNYLIESFNIDEVMFDDFISTLNYENVIDMDVTNHKVKNININDINTVVDNMLMQIELTNELVSQEPNIIQPPLLKTRASQYSYNSANGVAYANEYAYSNNPCFYTAAGDGGDCTNFISQCIWAAYGGWNPGDSITTMTNNINNRVRMMPSTTLSNWFGHQYGAGTPWESVNDLWNFATLNSGTGPRASGSNNNSVYKNLVAFAISSGDVLQVKRSGDAKYRHSVYVIFSSPKFSDDYNNIIVAQHSKNTTRALSDLISGWGGADCYMRKLTFNSAQFDK
nr:amidase domain-containing protein [uncultured Anaerocolumna sp.]